MNSDIRLSVGFWHHPKTKKLVKRLGLEGVRSLQILWLWSAQNKPDGRLFGMDWEDIELAADWQGEERAFFDYCLGIWIDEDDDGYVLHDWKEHNSWASDADVRSDASRLARMAKTYPDEYKILVEAGVKGISSNDYISLKDVKERKHILKRLLNDAQTTVEGPLNDAQTTVEGPLNDAQTTVEAKSTNAISPGPAPSPDQDIKKIKSIKACAEVANATSTPPPESPENPPEISLAGFLPDKAPDPCVIELPIVGDKTQTRHKVFASDVANWQSLYPGVDVMQQLRNMLGWLEAKPDRRKTKKGVRAFITSWLAKEQDKQNSARASPASQTYPVKSWLEREDETNFAKAMAQARANEAAKSKAV